MKYAWIEEHQDKYTISTMCDLLSVSRNGYYRWLKQGCNEEDDLLSFVKDIFEQSYKTYGTRRIKKELEIQYGWIVSRRRIGKVMKRKGLKARSKQRFRVQTTDSKHNLPKSIQIF